MNFNEYSIYELLFGCFEVFFIRDLLDNNKKG